MALFLNPEQAKARHAEIKHLQKEFDEASENLRKISRERDLIRHKMEDIFPNYESYDEDGNWKKGCGMWPKEKHSLRDIESLES